MTELEKLKLFCRKKMSEFPHFKEDIIMLYELAEMEIEDGESETEEINKALESINDVIYGEG
jgi:hypothetical protein